MFREIEDELKPEFDLAPRSNHLSMQAAVVMILQRLVVTDLFVDH